MAAITAHVGALIWLEQIISVYKRTLQYWPRIDLTFQIMMKEMLANANTVKSLRQIKPQRSFGNLSHTSGRIN